MQAQQTNRHIIISCFPGRLRHHSQRLTYYSFTARFLCRQSCFSPCHNVSCQLPLEVFRVRDVDDVVFLLANRVVTAVSLREVHSPRQSKVADLHTAILVHQTVCGFLTHFKTATDTALSNECGVFASTTDHDDPSRPRNQYGFLQ